MSESDPAGYPDLLRRTELFSEFSAESLTALASRLTERAYDRGDVLWQASDAGDELLLVLVGELEVLGHDTDGAEKLLGRVGPGECVGEMALILDELRSAKVMCSRAAKTLVLTKDDFRRYVRTDPLAMVKLAEILSSRAVALARQVPVAHSTLVVGVVAAAGVPGASLVARAVAQLAQETLGGDGLLVRLGEKGVALDCPAGELLDQVKARSKLPSLLDVEIGQEDAGLGAALALGVSSWLGALETSLRYVVIDFPALRDPLAAAAAACDAVIQVVATPASPPDAGVRVYQVVNQFVPGSRPTPIRRCEPFVLPVDIELARAMKRAGALPVTDTVRPAARVLQRLTRKLAGATVGVALGGGGAFGIAHVGVLLALTDAGIPVDLVSGTSMGSIVALGYASGLQPEAMLNIARRIGNIRTSLSVLDPSLSGTGLISGRRLISIFAPLLSHETFDELEVPCQVVAMDVETGERVDIGSGRLDRAFRASCSIPLIFTPVTLGGRTLVDGGMMDPVPADVAREMGADVVVAVNVVPRLERGTTTAISRTFKRVNRLNPLTYLNSTRDMPDIVDVFMNSLQATQHELGNYKAVAADVLLNVDMAEFTWIDFHRALDIIERGRIAGEAAVPAIRALLDRRVASVS